METIAELARAGVAPALIARLEQALGPGLLALQREALAETGLLTRGESVLVSAPTASGKTLLAELAALRTVGGGGMALYLVPTRALAEEKAAEFRRRWGPMGVRVVCSTRERRAGDAEVLAGRADIAVAVYEKALGLLARRASLLARVRLLVADELQLLGDGERGPALDFFLARWKGLARRPQLVALSAVLGNAAEVAAWLDVRLVESRQRVAPLREGVLDLTTGLFRWREASTGEIGREQLLAPRGDGADRWSALEALARERGPLILFCGTRSEANGAAHRLAERRPFPPAAQALEELGALQPDLSRERLEELLACGIGLHTADLPGRHRRAVEHAFERGEVPLLVATPTLEQGVNLAARTVVHSPLVVSGEALEPGLPALVPLGRARFQNQGGRAGRRAGETGRSILFAESEWEATQLWDATVRAPLEPLQSALGMDALVRGVADLLVRGESLERDEAIGAFARTFAARGLSREELTARVDAALERGVQAGLWRRGTESSLWQATALGETVARCGVQAPTLQCWAELLKGLTERPGQTATLFVVQLAEEWARFPLGVEAYQRRRGLWPSGVRERLAGNDALSTRLDALFESRGGMPYAFHKAARRTLLLDDWLGGLPVAEAELHHGLASGQMARLASESAWLTLAAVELSGALGNAAVVTEAFEETAEALERCAAELAPSPEEEDVARVEAVTTGEEDAPPDSPHNDRDEEQSEPKEAHVAAAWSLRFPAANAGTVVFNGAEYALTPLPYQLLRLLATRPGSVVGYEEIHQALWPDAAVEQQMVRYHKNQAERSLGLAPGELVRTRRRWGLALRLDPEQVQVEEEPEAGAAPLLHDSAG